MNQIKKLRQLLTKSKVSFANSSNKEIKTIKFIKLYKGPILFSSTIIGFGCITYFFVKNKEPVVFRDTSYSDINPDIIKNVGQESAILLSNRSSNVGEPSREDCNDLSGLNATNGLPGTIPYVIIGAGIAGMSAARAIRASDPFAKVLIINSECQSPGEHKEVYPPYRRLLLSKFVWRRTEEHKSKLLDTSGDVKTSSLLFLEPDSFFVSPANLVQLEYGGISLLNNTRVASIDPRESSITLEGSDHKIMYKACLIATGSCPRRLKHLEVSDNTKTDLYKDGKVSYFRSLNDFRNLFEKIKRLQSTEHGGRVLIIGSGLLGSELTSSLARLAKDEGKLEVVEVFKEKSHLLKLLPEPLSLYIQRSIRKTNTATLISESEVTSIGEIMDGPNSGRLNISIKSLSDSAEKLVTQEIVDHVVIATGVKPDTSLSIDSNLETDPILGGFMVNGELQAREGVFIAGDACSFYDPLLGRRQIEHWDHSEETGSIAGHNMAAFVLKNYDNDTLERIDTSKVANDILRPRTYSYQSSFAFKLSIYKTFEALGLVDSTLDTRTFITEDFFDEVDLEEEENREIGLKETKEGDLVKMEETKEGALKKREETKEGDLVKMEETKKGELVKVKRSPNDRLDMPGVVFYLRHRRIVGIVLWNCDDDIIVDSDFPSPLRTNVARRILSERRLIASDNDLRSLAADFDLSFFVNSQVKFLDQYTAKVKEKETALQKE